MILVTVGTHTRGFERLIMPMDTLATTMAEEMIIQRGHSAYVPSKARHFQFASFEEMVQLTLGSRIVVSHAAAGAILLGLKHGKPMVVVPRLRRHGEHTDDHQLQLAQAVHAAGLAIAVYDPGIDTLKSALHRGAALPVCGAGQPQLVSALRHRLHHLEMRRPATRFKRGG